MKKNFTQTTAAVLLCASLVPAFAAANEPVAATGTLSQPEKLSGWEMLFDGTTTEKWRNYKKDTVSDGWKIEDGALVRFQKGAGNIISKEKYKYFELSLEYKISKGGNSGIMFHVTEEFNQPYQSGPEIQVQDNVDGHDPQKAGWLYQMYQPRGGLDATRPVGEWNQVFLRIHPQQCEVSMNGNLYYRFKLGSKDWKAKVANSKFAKWEGFGDAGEGHICLQDHGNLVSYRNIKVRRLSEEGAAPQPITGKLGMQGELAFPKLKWDGWSAIDDAGKVRPLRIMELTYAKGDGNRLFAAAQNGAVFAFENSRDVEKADMILDLRDTVTQWNTRGANEEGLLGLAMHPDFTKNGQFFVYYTHKDDHRSVISRFVMKDGKVDRTAEEVILEMPQPFQNHNGGSIEFGPDGYLYIGTGDGGFRNDPEISGQNLGSLLGKILRIDVDGDNAGKYGVPSDNPFVGVEGARGEVYAFGLRNPWRISFDKASGRLWTGDVGQELWEEVNVIKKGGNYGWSRREGDFAFGNKEQPSIDVSPVGPVWAYDHLAGKSITGGRVYNSDRIAALKGKYVYADYVTGSVWALSYDPATGKATANEQVIAGGVPILAFGEDQNGEIYYTLANAKEQIFRFAK